MPLTTTSKLVWIETIFMVIMVYKFSGNGEFVSNTDVIEEPMWLYPTSGFQVKQSLFSSSNSSYYWQNTSVASYKKHKFHGKRNLMKNVKKHLKTTSVKNCTPFFIPYLQSTDEKQTEQKLVLPELKLSSSTTSSNRLEKTLEKQRGKFRNFFFPMSTSELVFNSEDKRATNSTWTNKFTTDTSSIPTYKKLKKSKMKNKPKQAAGLKEMPCEIENKLISSELLEEQSTTSSNLTLSNSLKNKDSIFSRSFLKKILMPKKSIVSKVSKCANVNISRDVLLERYDFENETSSRETKSPNEFSVEEKCTVCENNVTEIFSVQNGSKFKPNKTTVYEDSTMSENYITIFPNRINSLNSFAKGYTDRKMGSERNREVSSGLDDENCTALASSNKGFSAYTKVKFRDLLNFREPTTSTEKQKHITSYKTAGFAVKPGMNEESRVNGIPVAYELKSSTDKCIDSDFITPDSVHRGIVINPRVSSSATNVLKKNTIADELDLVVVNTNSTTTEAKNYTIPSYLINFRRLFHSNQEHLNCKNLKASTKRYSLISVPSSSDGSTKMVEDDFTKHFNNQHPVTSSDHSNPLQFHFMDIFNFKRPTSFKSFEVTESLRVNSSSSVTGFEDATTLLASTTNVYELQVPPTPSLDKFNKLKNVLNCSSQIHIDLENISETTPPFSTLKNLVHLKKILSFKKKTTGLHHVCSLPPDDEKTLSASKKFQKLEHKEKLNDSASTISLGKSNFTTCASFKMKNLLNFRKRIPSAKGYKVTEPAEYDSEIPGMNNSFPSLPQTSISNNREQQRTSNDGVSQTTEMLPVIFSKKSKLKNLFRFHRTSTLDRRISSDGLSEENIKLSIETNRVGYSNQKQNEKPITESNQNDGSDLWYTLKQSNCPMTKLAQNEKGFEFKNILNFNENKKQNEHTNTLALELPKSYFTSETISQASTKNQSIEQIETSKNTVEPFHWFNEKKEETDKVTTSFLNVKLLRRKIKPNKIVETEEGNIFKWIFRTSRSADETNPITFSVDNSLLKSQNGIFSTESIEETSSVPFNFKKRFKNMFSFKNKTNITGNNPSIDCTFTLRTEPVNSTSAEQNDMLPRDLNGSKKTNGSEVSSTLRNTKSKYPDRRKNIYSPIKICRDGARKIHKPFEKCSTPPTVNNKGNVSEFNIKSINYILKNMTRQTNSTFIMYPDYVEYLTLNKKGKKFKNTKFNKTFFRNNDTAANDTSFSFMYYVMKPFEKLVSVFRASPTNVTELGNININGSDLTNGSFPGHLHPPNDSLILVSQDRSRNATGAMHESNVGLLNMIGGWFLCLFDPFIEPKPKDIHFYLYTRNNTQIREELLLSEREEEYNEVNDTDFPEPILEKEDVLRTDRKKRQLEQDYNFEPLDPSKSEVRSTWFNVLSDTKVLVHGFTQDSLTDIMVRMKDAYLTKGTFNVILVDWSSVGDDLCYPHVAKAVRSVGAIVAQLLDALLEGGVSPTQVHVVGFSLGAHVAGHAGTRLKHGLISRISGLDPALPWVSMDSDVSLDPGDAAFVDLIHSAAGYLGQPGPMGHVDFYPNGGSQQPGCDIVSLGICSHRRAALYFIESITSEVGFPATFCDSWPHFQAGQCDHSTTLFMGEPCPSNASGKYYLVTGQKEPFSQLPEEHAKVKKSLLFDLFYDFV